MTTRYELDGIDGHGDIRAVPVRTMADILREEAEAAERIDAARPSWVCPVCLARVPHPYTQHGSTVDGVRVACPGRPAHA